VKPDSVRFYERNGLLPKPPRSANGYRVYDEAALKRLQFIKKALKTVQGVDKVRANSRNQRIDVLLDTVVVDAAAIAECLRTAGYQTKFINPT